MEKSCPLCKLVASKKTKLYYADKVVMVTNCPTCRTPIIVLKKHAMNANNFEIVHMEMVPKEVFGENIKFRKKQGHPAYDHLHWHILGGNQSCLNQ